MYTAPDCAARAVIRAVPAGVFVARKGFDYGWMDVEGNWIYCQSIFTSTSDETNNYFY